MPTSPEQAAEILAAAPAPAARAREIKRKLLGEDHPDTALSSQVFDRTLAPNHPHRQHCRLLLKKLLPEKRIAVSPEWRYGVACQKCVSSTFGGPATP